MKTLYRILSICFVLYFITGCCIQSLPPKMYSFYIKSDNNNAISINYLTERTTYVSKNYSSFPVAESSGYLPACYKKIIPKMSISNNNSNLRIIMIPSDYSISINGQSYNLDNIINDEKNGITPSISSDSIFNNLKNTNNFYYYEMSNTESSKDISLNTIEE